MYLDETRAGLVESVQDLSDVQMSFKPALQQWSVAETLEHLTLTEEFFLQNVKPQLEGRPGASPDSWELGPPAGGLTLLRIGFGIAHLFVPYSLRLIAQRMGSLFAVFAHALAGDMEAVVMARMRNRSTKYQAPPELVPRGRWTAEEALRRFLRGRQQTLSFLKQKFDLRRHTVSHPAVGRVDGYVFVLALAAHCERHTKQIHEMKANLAFPRRDQRAA
jgi:hypothetical protein